MRRDDTSTFGMRILNSPVTTAVDNPRIVISNGIAVSPKGFVNR